MNHNREQGKRDDACERDLRFARNGFTKIFHDIFSLNPSETSRGRRTSVPSPLSLYNQSDHNAFERAQFIVKLELLHNTSKVRGFRAMPRSD